MQYFVYFNENIKMWYEISKCLEMVLLKILAYLQELVQWHICWESGVKGHPYSIANKNILVCIIELFWES